MTPELRPHLAGFAMLRLSALADGAAAAPQYPERTSEDTVLRDFLARVAADPLAREAIAVSSLPLDEVLGQIAGGLPVKRKYLRGSTASVSRYLIRMRSRATPFGLMAGVAPAWFGENAKVALGTDHRKGVRPDQGWLKNVVRILHQDPGVLRELRVAVNDLCAERGERLVLGIGATGEEAGGCDDLGAAFEVSASARRALELAKLPIPYSDLARRLCAEFPGERDTVDRLLERLVEADFLLTDLQPPVASMDPLGHVLDRLAQLDSHPVRLAIENIQARLAEYAAAPVGAGYGGLRAAAAAMGKIHATDRPVQVDVAVDADVVLPHAIGTELATAASLTWRLAAPQPVALESYRARFLERYGLGGLVPVRELLDLHRGLGPPARSAMPLGPPGPVAHTGAAPTRDTVLCGLAERAAAHREREIVLDETLVTRLATPAHANRSPSYVEICARVFADSVSLLQAGDFRLLLGSPNYTRPGALFGRFLHLLPEFREPFITWVRELAGDWDPASAVQLVGVTTNSSAANVSQIPRLAETVLAVGVFADQSDPHVLRLDDVAVGATQDRMYAISLRTGEEIVPLTFHASHMASTAPAAVRFLFHIGAYRTPRWPLWEWGTAASLLPYLPRVRYNRTVLTSARWLPDPRLRNGDLGWEEWRAELDRWRADWDVPDHVEVGKGDWVLPLDLTAPADLEILRDELARGGARVVCREEPLDGEYGTGWAGGRAAEVVVALRPAESSPVVAPKLSLPVGVAAVPLLTRPAFRPGGEWLYARLGAAAEVHDEIISRHLPDLLERAESRADRWVFVRYADREPELRIRFHGAPRTLTAELVPELHEWVGRVADAGLLSDFTFATYRPEIAQYGGPSAMAAAERAFCADARAVTEMLTLRDRGYLKLPLAVLAAGNCLDLAARLLGPGWQEWLLATYPRDDHRPAFRAYRREALGLVAGVEDADALAGLPDGDLLRGIWDRRGPDVACYGHKIQDLVSSGKFASVRGPIRSILHVHINRLAGLRPLVEAQAYAIARGGLQSRADQRAHAGQSSEKV